MWRWIDSSRSQRKLLGGGRRREDTWWTKEGLKLREREKNHMRMGDTNSFITKEQSPKWKFCPYLLTCMPKLQWLRRSKHQNISQSTTVSKQHNIPKDKTENTRIPKTHHFIYPVILSWPHQHLIDIINLPLLTAPQVPFSMSARDPQPAESATVDLFQPAVPAPSSAQFVLRVTEDPDPDPDLVTLHPVAHRWSLRLSGAS